MDAHKRIASSEIMTALFGDVTLFQEMLEVYVPSLITLYGGETSLPEHFRAISSRIICVCPMVLCQEFLADFGKEAPSDLVGPLGLAMYSISTHDDVVDERPEGREVVAGLIYAGNIASLHGISLLVGSGYTRIVETIIRLMNLNHCFQTDIVSSIWKKPSDEVGYLKAINHTGYWAAIGTMAAAEYVLEFGSGTVQKTGDIREFAMEFGRLYGRMCQLYDDVREIGDDLRNGYFSLPISIALERSYDLNVSADQLKAVVRPKEIAEQSFREICTLCGEGWPRMLHLADRMHEIGQQILPA